MLFGKINDIELYSHSFRHVSYVEEKPLIIALGINIILKDQVILIELFLINSKQISTLKIRTKLNLISEGHGCRVGFLTVFHLILQFLLDNCFSIKNVCSVVLSVLISLVMNVFPLIILLNA